MNKVLLSIHVLAAIIFVGPVTVAATMFPPLARKFLAADDPDSPVLRMLHRITRVYAIGAIIVPVFGIAVGAGLGDLGEYWLTISMVLTAAAAAVLVFLVLPAQSRVLDATPEGRAALLPQARALSMTTGIFALLWAV